MKSFRSFGLLALVLAPRLARAQPAGETPEVSSPSEATAAVPSSAAASPAIAPAEVDPHDRRGFWFAARVSVGAPFGNALAPSAGASGPPISEAATSAALLALQLDAGYRITPHWRVGGYFQIADAFSGTGCSGCGGYDARFGVTGEAHFLPAWRGDPWVGLGAGYEVLHTSSSSPGTPSAITAYRGFEYAAPEVGVDIRVGRTRVRWGPWASLTFAEYDHVRQITSRADLSLTPAEELHLWFFLGLRMTVDL